MRLSLKILPVEKYAVIANILGKTFDRYANLFGGVKNSKRTYTYGSIEESLERDSISIEEQWKEWKALKISHGWKYGKKYSEEYKTHPDLVDELSSASFSARDKTFIYFLTIKAVEDVFIHFADLSTVKSNVDTSKIIQAHITQGDKGVAKKEAEEKEAKEKVKEVVKREEIGEAIANLIKNVLEPEKSHVPKREEQVADAVLEATELVEASKKVIEIEPYEYQEAAKKVEALSGDELNALSSGKKVDKDLLKAAEKVNVVAKMNLTPREEIDKAHETLIALETLQEAKLSEIAEAASDESAVADVVAINMVKTKVDEAKIAKKKDKHAAQVSVVEAAKDLQTIMKTPAKDRGKLKWTDFPAPAGTEPTSTDAETPKHTLVTTSPAPGTPNAVLTEAQKNESLEAQKNESLEERLAKQEELNKKQEAELDALKNKEI